MKRLVRHFRFLRIFTLRRCTFALAALTTLIAAFYIVENWRGERAWAAARERLRTAGEPVTIEQWLPKPPPDNENFMLNPVFMRRPGFGRVVPTRPARGHFEWTEIKVAADNRAVPFPYEALGVVDGSGRPDLLAIAAFLPAPLRPPAGTTQQLAAQAVLQWVAQCEPDLGVLIEAARTRPASHLPWVDEADMATRWESLTGWLDLAKLLQLRALAQATAGDAQGALDSIQLMLRLGQAVAADPAFFVNYVLSAGVVALVPVPLNHALATHLWTDVQLEQIESLLGRIDFRADFRRAWRGERFYFSRAVEEVIAGDGRVFTLVHPRVPESSLAFFPRGWWRQNQVRAVDWQIEQDRRLRAAAGVRSKLETSPAVSPTNPFTVLFSLFLRGTAGLETATDTLEGTFNLARIAVGLERHRLAHGGYPQALGDLAPFFPHGLPSDPFSGKAPRYVLADGRPRVWSVGQNQRDDGGREDSTGADDLVWTYPAQ